MAGEEHANARHPCQWLEESRRLEFPQRTAAHFTTLPKCTARAQTPCQENLWEESPPAGLRFCVQQPGEVIYFGPRLAPSSVEEKRASDLSDMGLGFIRTLGFPCRLHATCNLDPFVFGIGAQGRLPKMTALEPC